MDPMSRRICTQAVVLGRQWLGESNALVTLLSEDLGKIKVMAPGARRSRRRFSGCLDLFARITAWMVDKGSSRMPRLEEAVLLDSHEPMKSNLWAIGQAGYFTELTAALIGEKDEALQLYQTLNRILSLLDHRHFHPLEIRLYELKVLSLAGFGPDFMACLECGQGTSAGWSFDPFQGGVLCTACAETAGSSTQRPWLTPEELQLLRCLQVGRMPERSPDSQTMNSLRSMLGKLIDGHVGHPLKSRQFLMQLASESGSCK